jgi:hypothetical protein
LHSWCCDLLCLLFSCSVLLFSLCCFFYSVLLFYSAICCFALSVGFTLSYCFALSVVLLFFCLLCFPVLWPLALLLIVASISCSADRDVGSSWLPLR